MDVLIVMMLGLAAVVANATSGKPSRWIGPALIVAALVMWVVAYS
jgi:hypothetical protein